MQINSKIRMIFYTDKELEKKKHTGQSMINSLSILIIVFKIKN